MYKSGFHVVLTVCYFDYLQVCTAHYLQVCTAPASYSAWVCLLPMVRRRLAAWNSRSHQKGMVIKLVCVRGCALICLRWITFTHSLDLCPCLSITHAEEGILGVGIVKKSRNFHPKTILKITIFYLFRPNFRGPIRGNLFKFEMQLHCCRDPRDASRNEWYEYSNAN